MRHRRRDWRPALTYVALATVALLSMSFVIRAAGLGWAGLTTDLTGVSRLFAADGWLSNPAIFGHMIPGAIITLLAPLQLVAPLRNRYPRVHRWTGYVFFVCALASAVGGTTYIVVHGTIGGPLMDVGFAAYGVCVFAAAIQTVRYARARQFDRHREWALRLFFLAIGSWIYRAHYSVWFFMTGGLWVAPGFTGPFDQFQIFAFYVPYLIGLEVYFRLRRGTVPTRQATAG